MDFGLSFICKEFAGTSYWSSRLGGVVRYRAPELLAPAWCADIDNYVPELTLQCDVYSFGILMLYVREQLHSNFLWLLDVLRFRSYRENARGTAPVTTAKLFCTYIAVSSRHARRHALG